MNDLHGQVFLNSMDTLDLLEDDRTLFINVQFLSRVKKSSTHSVNYFIQGSVQVNLNSLLDSSLYPNMMIETDLLKKRLSELGVCTDKTIILYEQDSIYAGPRLWWMLKAIGYHNVFILNSTLKDWLSQGLPTDNTLIEYNNTCKEDVGENGEAQLFCNSTLIEKAIGDNRNFRIIDARSKARYLGQENEARANLKSGHIPTALNMPFNIFFSENKIIPVENIEEEFFSRGISKDHHLVIYCGSGVTACIVGVCALSAGFKNVSIYDASWAEWGLKELGKKVCTNIEICSED